jgi:lactobin A/cerein 7B family class IIb bacteriocin
MTKKFELSAYGVEEMNQKELVDVEGGYWWIVVAVDAACILVTGYSMAELLAMGTADLASYGSVVTNADLHGRR